MELLMQSTSLTWQMHMKKYSLALFLENRFRTKQSDQNGTGAISITMLPRLTQFPPYLCASRKGDLSTQPFLRFCTFGIEFSIQEREG